MFLAFSFTLVPDERSITVDHGLAFNIILFRLTIFSGWLCDHRDHWAPIPLEPFDNYITWCYRDKNPCFLREVSAINSLMGWTLLYNNRSACEATRNESSNYMIRTPQFYAVHHAEYMWLRKHPIDDDDEIRFLQLEYRSSPGSAPLHGSTVA